MDSVSVFNILKKYDIVIWRADFWWWWRGGSARIIIYTTQLLVSSVLLDSWIILACVQGFLNRMWMTPVGRSLILFHFYNTVKRRYEMFKTLRSPKDVKPVTLIVSAHVTVSSRRVGPMGRWKNTRTINTWMIKWPNISMTLIGYRGRSLCLGPHLWISVQTARHRLRSANSILTCVHA